MGGAPSFILPGLWLGGQDVLNDPTFFSKNGITHVLSLGPATPSDRIRLTGREHINVPDVPVADLRRHFAKVVRFIARSRHDSGGTVYVHCAAGISRSTTCLCAYLMVHLGLSFQQVLAFVTSRRKTVCPNDGFQRQLKSFEGSEELRALSKELASYRDYEQIRKRDLDEVRSSSSRPDGGGGNRPGSQNRQASQPVRRSGSGSTSIEAQAQQNALKAVKEAMAAEERRQGGAAGRGRRIGTGESDGDVGLGWLLQGQANDRGLGTRSQPPAGLPSGGMLARRSASHGTGARL
eukprot:CAMPEP_0178421560 /NCGR_PEP_ID=MMETSP0689_2-20121128/26709_1 /TAXON_ID=160604 /ORGANISM="Amphidinium massartii, Strain CS-259" /LENGTH=292 /DNA_ID=CAMNT_0020043073 /DNA_START=50 /DNA_END=925 /DNA_ORIENTATION=-